MNQVLGILNKASGAVEIEWGTDDTEIASLPIHILNRRLLSDYTPEKSTTLITPVFRRADTYF